MTIISFQKENFFLKKSKKELEIICEVAKESF